MKTLTRLLLATLFLASAPLARAQSEEPVRFEIRDGKIYVDGEEKTPDADGRIIIRRETDDGEREVIIYEHDSDADGPRVFFGDGNNDYRVRTDGGRSFWFSGDHDEDAVADLFRRVPRQEDLRRPMEEARRQLEMAGIRSAPALFERMGMAGPFLTDEESREMRDELRQLERSIRESAEQIRHADAADRAALERQLDDHLREALELKHEMRAMEIERLQERLGTLQQELQERRAAEAEILERRKRELLGERNPLDW